MLKRNTIRKDNAFFSWDIRLSRPFNFGRQGTFEAIFEVFNVTNTTALGAPNTTLGSAAFGTITSAGDPRVSQLALKFVF